MMGRGVRQISLNVETAEREHSNLFEATGTYSQTGSNFTISLNNLSFSSSGSTRISDVVNAGINELGDTGVFCWYMIEKRRYAHTNQRHRYCLGLQKEIKPLFFRDMYQGCFRAVH